MILSVQRRRAARAWHALAMGAALSLAATGPAHAQPEAPANVVSLQATGVLQVPQDWLTIVLSATKEGADPATVQNQLKVAVDAALAMAQAQARPQQLEVRTGNLRLYPRYASAGRISGWQGQAELVIEGRDIARLGELAGRIQTMNVSNMGFSLSRDARRALESQAQAQAIERFKARAGEIAKGFGFSSWTLREVNLSSADGPDHMPVPRVMAMEAKAAASDMPVPTAAGNATVSVTASGSIQLK